MVKIYPILFLLTSIFGCNEVSEGKHLDVNIHTSQHKTNTKDSIMSKDKLMSLTKSEAVREFGEPTTQEKFILDDAQGEFRNTISDAFSAKERQSKSILIEEVTWEKDDATWITVWYAVEAEKLTPKGYFEWSKDSEF